MNFPPSLSLCDGIRTLHSVPPAASLFAHCSGCRYSLPSLTYGTARCLSTRLCLPIFPCLLLLPFLLFVATLIGSSFLLLFAGSSWLAYLNQGSTSSSVYCCLPAVFPTRHHLPCCGRDILFRICTGLNLIPAASACSLLAWAVQWLRDELQGSGCTLKVAND